MTSDEFLEAVVFVALCIGGIITLFALVAVTAMGVETITERHGELTAASAGLVFGLFIMVSSLAVAAWRDYL